MGAESGRIDPHFVIARFAQWAGDTELALKLFRKIGRGRRASDFYGKPLSPSEVIVAASLRRSGQIVRNRKSLRDYVPRDQQEEELSVAIETRHLRAVIWQFETDEYEMRGFLTDLGWEGRLFENARRLAGDQQKQPIGDSKNNKLPVRLGRGIGWTLTGDRASRITVDELGLIQSRTAWQPPQAQEAVLEHHRRILRLLEEPTGAGVKSE